MARKPREFTTDDKELMYQLAKIHCTNEEIASILKTSKDTLERRFVDILHRGRAEGRSSLRRLQWAKAEKGDTTMLIWLGRQILRQSDKIGNEGDGEKTPARVEVIWNVKPSPAGSSRSGEGNQSWYDAPPGAGAAAPVSGGGTS